MDGLLVGSTLQFFGATELEHVLLPELTHIGGSLLVFDQIHLKRFDIPKLDVVQGWNSRKKQLLMTSEKRFQKLEVKINDFRWIHDLMILRSD